jgi:hypothetical protein
VPPQRRNGNKCRFSPTLNGGRWNTLSIGSKPSAGGPNYIKVGRSVKNEREPLVAALWTESSIAGDLRPNLDGFEGSPSDTHSATDLLAAQK